jgi:azurin
MKIIKTMFIVLIVSQANSALAASCEQTIEGNDMLQFNLKEIVVSSTCSEVTINLKHTGQLASNIMGHNWVLSKTEDFMPLALAGGSAGPSENYVPSNDPRVIASSPPPNDANEKVTDVSSPPPIIIEEAITLGSFDGT